jgi:tetratricopeptide (TPR) repeat protein
MRQLECTECRKSVPAATGFVVNDQYLCEPCANQKVAALQKAKGKLSVVRGQDPTICFKCSADFGSQELPRLAGMNLCSPCQQQIIDFRYPAWLKNAGAVLLLLLVFSLYHGRTYFLAGHSYYKGMKLLESGDAADAVPHFEEALKIGPRSARIIQYAALANIKSGRIERASRIVEGQKFSQDDLFRSLNAEFDRFEQAAKIADEGAKLYSDGKYGEGAQRMHAAAMTFPAFSGFQAQALEMDSGIAFYSKDYDAMVRLSEAAWKQSPDYPSAASLAGAYACVYADRGDTAYRQKALDMMEKSRSFATSKEEKEDFAEWEARFDHRIRTRKILTREQYLALPPAEKSAEAVNQ